MRCLFTNITAATSVLVSWLTLSCTEPADVPRAIFFARQIDGAEASFDRERFASNRKDTSLALPIALEGETRLALVPPVPSSLTYRVDVPSEPVLSFAIGVSTTGQLSPPAPVVFSVSVSTETEAVVAFEDVVPRRWPNRWHERQVDLGPWAGKEVELSFSIRFRETAYTRKGEELLRAAGALIPAWGAPVLDTRRRASSRPNVLLVSVDCLRADHVGAYGYERETTPVIDAMAEEGVVFGDVVSVSSWTLPTHMSMLTGVMPAQHGASRTSKRDGRVPALPEVFAEAGYEALGVVSGSYLSQAFGFEEGFDVYHVLKDGPADDVVDRAIELLGEGARDRFLFVHFFDAHWPYWAPGRYARRFTEMPDDAAGIMRKVVQRDPPKDGSEIQFLTNLYDAEIAFVDHELGRLFSVLKDKGIYDDTIIVVTADHGEGFYEHEQWQHSEILYNEVTSIPLIVKWPGGSPRGSYEGMVTQLHIFPTLLEAASLNSPHAHPGLGSFLESGEGDAVGVAVSEITWEPNERRGPAMRIAVRQGDLKYIAELRGEKGESLVSEIVREELYDVSIDPGEQHNLLPDAATEAQELRAWMRAYLEEVRRWQAGRRGEKVVLDDELRERLRALGYVE